MEITLKSGRDLIDIPSKKNKEVQVKLVLRQVEEKKVVVKYAKNLGKCEYPKTTKVEPSPERPSPPFP